MNNCVETVSEQF